VQHVNSELAIHLQHNVTVILSDRIPMVEKSGKKQQHGTAQRTPLIRRGRSEYKSFVAYSNVRQGYDANHMTKNLTRIALCTE
jgi:hypothetical protein